VLEPIKVEKRNVDYAVVDLCVARLTNYRTRT